jgi:hypothetical protein
MRNIIHRQASNQSVNANHRQKREVKAHARKKEVPQRRVDRARPKRDEVHRKNENRVPQRSEGARLRSSYLIASRAPRNQERTRITANYLAANF